jgi:hypothetical protein
VAAGATIDCEFAALAAYPGSLRDKELAWLQNNGATSNQLGDAWYQFLIAQGMTAAARPDMEVAYYISLGLDAIVNSKALIDLRQEFWCGGHNPP